MAEQTVYKTNLREVEHTALDNMGVRRFDLQQMFAIAGNVRESISQRIRNGGSIPG